MIAPKRDEARELQTQIDPQTRRSRPPSAQIAIAEQARDDFPKNYGDLVKLGRAVPEDDDQATLVYDMAGLGKQNDAQLPQTSRWCRVRATRRCRRLPSHATPADAAATRGGAGERRRRADSTAQGTPQTVAAPATEATAATLPIGAQIGPAGLPVDARTSSSTRASFFDVAGLPRRCRQQP